MAQASSCLYGDVDTTIKRTRSADTLPFQGGNASIKEGMHEEKNMSQKKKGE